MTPKNMLDVSTAHMPPPKGIACSTTARPDFGMLGYCAHEYGWIVFVYGSLDDAAREETIPKWMRPIYVEAERLGCILINFDMNGEVCSDFPTYDW